MIERWQNFYMNSLNVYHSEWNSRHETGKTIDEYGGLDDFCVQSPNDEEIIWFKYFRLVDTQSVYKVSIINIAAWWMYKRQYALVKCLVSVP